MKVCPNCRTILESAEKTNPPSLKCPACEKRYVVKNPKRVWVEQKGVKLWRTTEVGQVSAVEVDEEKVLVKFKEGRIEHFKAAPAGNPPIDAELDALLAKHLKGSPVAEKEYLLEDIKNWLQKKTGWKVHANPETNPPHDELFKAKVKLLGELYKNRDKLSDADVDLQFALSQDPEIQAVIDEAAKKEAKR